MPRKLLVGEVGLEDLLERLAFAEEDTVHATLEQAKLYMAAASFRIHKMRKRQETEMYVDNLRVDMSLHIRKKYKGEKGVTEKFISERVNKMQVIRAAELEAAKAKRMEEYAKHLLDAYEHRRTSLKILAQFAFMDDSFTGKSEVNRLSAKRDSLRKMHREAEEF
jgi:hypothetical protein